MKAEEILKKMTEDLEAEGHDVLPDEDEWGNILLVCRVCKKTWKIDWS